MSIDLTMLAREYTVGFQVLQGRIGLWPALRIILVALVKSLMTRFNAEEGADDAERSKAELKNHFKLLAFMCQGLERRYGTTVTNEIMREVLLKGGEAYFRRFTRLGPDGNLLNFIEIYKAFESHNIVFDVIEETERSFEIVISRCLVFESFKELGVSFLAQWMCDIAFSYFNHYHPRINYEKDRMIARGDENCHEVFVWK